MNASLFIAKRLLIAKEENNRYTRPIIRIAILAIALSLAVKKVSIKLLHISFKSLLSITYFF